MRKQELLQLHGLFGELRRYLARQDDVRVPADAYAAYDEHGVTPTFIPAGKEAHATAVELLADGLVTTVTHHHDADTDADTDADVDADAVAELDADAEAEAETDEEAEAEAVADKEAEAEAVADTDSEGRVATHPTD